MTLGLLVVCQQVRRGSRATGVACPHPSIAPISPSPSGSGLSIPGPCLSQGVP